MNGIPAASVPHLYRRGRYGVHVNIAAPENLRTQSPVEAWRASQLANSSGNDFKRMFKRRFKIRAAAKTLLQEF